MSGAIAKAFEQALRNQGTALTHEDLLRQYPTSATQTSSSSTIIASLEQCEFYDEFSSQPHEANAKMQQKLQEAKHMHGNKYVNKILSSKKHHALKKHRQYDFRLDDEETNKLQQNGFVVSQRMCAESFAEIYYRLYSDDMPVYITSDSVLHAWHRSFDAFLVELEEKNLRKVLIHVLQKISAACHGLHASASDVACKRVVLDVDLYVSIALELLTATRSHVLPENKQRAAVTHKAIERQELTFVSLFCYGETTRQVDFSLFKPRGHYTKSTKLMQYFQAMTWLGTIDFRVDGTENEPQSDLYQLQCACMVVYLLRCGDKQVLDSVKTLETVISSIAGDGIGCDSMTPLQLHELLASDCDILATYCAMDSEASLTSLQGEIATRGFGAQAIAGHPMTESQEAASSSTAGPTRLPTSFAFLGQQFVWSAFVLSKLVYDQVIQGEEKIVRRMPSAVDVAFALFGQNVASQEIANRMAASTTSDASEGFVRFRDGVPYASNLVALRQVIDHHFSSSADPATCSVAMLWQLALRELSQQSADSASVFASETWQKRQMNTQLASFTQLRHDTILYAKQSFTRGTRCEYAAGFVDPYPLFWARMQQLGEKMDQLLARLQVLFGTRTDGDEDDDDDKYGSTFQSKATRFFSNFTHVTRQLTEISIAQSLHRPLSDPQTQFLKNVMEERGGSGGSRYLGWYPSLFYLHREDSGKQDHLVADIHTDVPSVEHGDPGGVLHLGVGNVNMGFFIVENVMYAGPVFSSYEFVTTINERLTDGEFSERLDEFEPPKWATESFLAESKALHVSQAKLGFRRR